jgi:hypothetical protein
MLSATSPVRDSSRLLCPVCQGETDLMSVSLAPDVDVVRACVRGDDANHSGWIARRTETQPAPASMSFAEAYAAMTALARSRGDLDMKLAVHAWSISDGACRDTIEWEIWCGSRQVHYHGKTAEMVLAAYRAGVEHGAGVVTSDALAAIGAA